VWTFGQTWVWMAITLYVIGVSNGRFVLMPRVGRLIALQRELVASGPPTAGSGPPPQVLEMEKVGKQVAAVGTALNLLLGVLLVLMVFKPGGP